MASREEIREGMRQVILKYVAQIHFDPQFEELAELLWAYLHSQGVVIKVDNGNDLTGCCIARFEPLIKEE